MDGTIALAVLGLAPGATAPQIKAAFRARAKLVHPDRHGAVDAFVRLRRAHDVALAALAPRTAVDGGAGREVDGPSAPQLAAAAGGARPAATHRPSRWVGPGGEPVHRLDVVDITTPSRPRTGPARRPATADFAAALALALAG